MEIKKRSNRTGPKKRTSSGGKGRHPRVKNGRIRTGGYSNNRNRHWSIAKKSSLIKLIKSDKKESEIKELECHIWLDTNNQEQAQKCYKALIKLIEDYGFELSREMDAQKGSWFKPFWIKTKELANSKEVQGTLDKMQRALELKHIDSIQADTTLKNAQSVATLIESTKDLESFAIVLDTLVFAKATINGKIRVYAENLTQEQAEVLKKNPILKSNPAELIIKMEEYKAAVIELGEKKKLAAQ